MTLSFDRDWLARTVTALASEHLMSRFGRVSGSEKADGSLLTEADLAMQSALIDTLAEKSPEIPVLAEEQTEREQARLLTESTTGVWCLDPLDGTTNFASGVPFFAVSLALIGPQGVKFGLVHDPCRQETFTAIRGEGAWLNGARLRLDSAIFSLAESVAVVDFKRLPGPLSSRLAVSPPYRSQRSFGSVAMDWCWLAAGRFQLYLHGGQKLWDYSAGHLVAAEAGAAVCLAETVEENCGFDTVLGSKVGSGAINETLMQDWRNWIRSN